LKNKVDLNLETLITSKNNLRYVQTSIISWVIKKTCASDFDALQT